ncbi:MAG: twin-arginine translocase TatA/TatE family subunit [Chloroflexi bacterium]|nr:twin-arginine translocase TatA/TatE family subunit [Chloroflexota bacterium]
MPQLGAPELILVLVIVIVVFGVGRLGEIGGAVGKAIREFRNATGDENAAAAPKQNPGDEKEKPA